MKRFKIVLLPATHEEGRMRSFTWEPFSPEKYPTVTVTGENTDDAITAARTFALEHGEPCFAMLSCLDKPKPRGFERATSSHNNLCWFNIPARVAA